MRSEGRAAARRAPISIPLAMSYALILRMVLNRALCVNTYVALLSVYRY